MNFSSLSAADRRLVIVGGLIALISVISFLDPSGSWGPIMILALLGGLLAAFVAMQSQVAPTMKLPATRGLTLLAAGGAAVIGFALAMLTYIGYISRNLIDVFVILMIVGLIASIWLAWTAWRAYQAEPKAGAPAATASAAPAPAAPAAAQEPPAAAPPPPPPADPA